MKKLGLFLLAFLIPMYGQASHIVGGEFELVHVAGSIYRLNLILYFDLHNGNPGAKDPSADVRIFRKSDDLIMREVNLPLTQESEVLYTALECTIGELQTLKLLYSTLIELGGDDFDDPQGYYVTWERCCRNYGISNIYSEVSINPDGSPNPLARYAGQAFYLEFPPVVMDGEPFIDSTPKLFPPLSDYACVDKPYYVDFAGSDDDGDSLVYSLATPLNTKSGDALPPGGFPRPRPYPDVIWQPGFSLSNVMKGKPDLAISNEGLLTVTPTEAGLFAFAVKCEEFRNGIKIGETRRDFQMLAVTCPTSAFPTINGVDPDHPGTVFKDVMNVTFEADTPDDKRCIQVNISDPDAQDGDVKVTLRAKGVKGSGGEAILPDIKTSTINSANNKATFKICFDKCPPVYNTPYQILIIAADDACAVPLQDTLRINVTVKSSPNGKVEFIEPVSDVALVLKQGAPKLTWPIHAVDPDGDSIEFSYLVDGFTLANAGMKLTASQLQQGTVTGEFSWDPSCNFDFTTKQNFNITLLANDKDMCGYNKADMARFNLTVIPPPKPEVTITQPTCSLATGTITVKVKNADDVYSFNNGVSFQKANSQSGLLPGVYQVIAKSSSGCRSVVTKATIQAQPEIPKPEITVAQTTCSSATGLIIVTVKNATDVYSFDGGATFQTGSIKAGLAGTYSIVVKNMAGCSSVPIKTTIAAQPPSPAIPVLTITQSNPFPICTGVGAITVAIQNLSDTYSFDNGVSFQTANSKSGLAAGSYRVIIKNSMGCNSVAVAANIALLPAPTVAVVQPTCASKTGTITVTVQNATDVYSFDGGSTFQSSNTKSGLEAGSYAVVIQDVNGCKSIVTPTVVNPPALPPPEITVVNPTCTLATGTIAVTVRQATDTYSFNDGVTFQVSNSKSGLLSNTYYVLVKDNTGCTSLPAPMAINPQPQKPNQPVVTDVTHPTCTVPTGSITIASQRDGDTFSFDNGVSFQTGSTKAGLETGTYQVIIKNKEGCNSAAAGAVINIQPPVPLEPMVTVSQPPCIGSLGGITVKSQKPGDTFSFDGGLNFQMSNAMSGLAPGIYPIIIKNSVGCNSITKSTTVNPPPAAPALAVISGSPIVCPNSTDIEYSADVDSYAYVWFIRGGTLRSRLDNKIKVDWGKSTANAWVKAIATSSAGCPVDTMTFAVKIQTQLKPAKPRGLDSVCYNARNEVIYQTSSTNGSVYTWYLNNVIYSDAKSTPNVSIDWREVGQYRLWVNEKNATCAGVSDTLIVSVFRDPATINMDFASVDFENVNRVQLQWKALIPNRVSDSVKISRKTFGSDGPWEVIATLNKNVHTFQDDNVLPAQYAYDYKVEGFNKCDELIGSVTHNTIKLEGQKVEEEDMITLSWNAYQGWEEIGQYEIWRKLDGAANFELLHTNAGDLTEYSGKHGSDGFIQVLRIKAREKNADTFSWSNEIELRFENPIDVPNVITPNGDDKNEYFTIRRLPLYPGHQLTIFNHWGEMVFQSRDYKNDWRANNLPSGVYYYALYIRQTDKLIKGWLQVMR